MKKSKTTRLREVMSDYGITVPALATAVGLNPRTIHNIACGSSKSAKARQAVTNFLGTSVWSGVNPTEHHITLPAGVEIPFGKDRECASDAAKEFAAYARLKENTLVFIKPVEVVVRFSGERSPATTEKPNE